jgi:hypothetical protein
MFVTIMPEIWLNYGITNVVLDIKAENLEENITSRGDILDDGSDNNNEKIVEKFANLDTSKPMDLVLLHYTKSIQNLISVLFNICERRSHPIPKILTDKKIIPSVKSTLPEGSAVSEFDGSIRNTTPATKDDNDKLSRDSSNLVFVGEMELDGLFGYDTIATRLLRRFGKENMLTAYAKRKDNLPSPGQITQSIDEAKKFADNFDIQGIEIIANSKGIVDFAIGHPSKTMSLSKTFESVAIPNIPESQQQRYKSLIISTGKTASNDTLGRSLNSLWNCSPAIKNDGLAILIAECKFGIGSQAIQQYIEDRLTIEKLRNPTKYIDGMEDLLFLSEIKKKFQIGLVSILPEFYVKKLDMIPFYGIKRSMDYILKTQGARQKVSIVEDGSRVLLR